MARAALMIAFKAILFASILLPSLALKTNTKHDRLAQDRDGQKTSVATDETARLRSSIQTLNEGYGPSRNGGIGETNAQSY